MKAAGFGILAFLFFQCAVLPAEDAAIGEIKKLYTETAAAIALAQKGEAGGLYCNELAVNSRNGSWRAVGNYAKKIAFWYSDQPEFATAEGQEAEAVLAKVEVRETAAVRSLYREFFFAGGRLLFFFCSEKSGDEPVSEERIYFKDGKPVLRLLGQEKASGSIQTEAISREAGYWQKLFLLTFGD
jgi:hypothetical protein